MTSTLALSLAANVSESAMTVVVLPTPPFMFTTVMILAGMAKLYPTLLFALQGLRRFQVLPLSKKVKFKRGETQRRNLPAFSKAQARPTAFKSQ